MFLPQNSCKQQNRLHITHIGAACQDFHHFHTFFCGIKKIQRKVISCKSEGKYEFFTSDVFVKAVILEKEERNENIPVHEVHSLPPSWSSVWCSAVRRPPAAALTFQQHGDRPRLNTCHVFIKHWRHDIWQSGRRWRYIAPDSLWCTGNIDGERLDHRWWAFLLLLFQIVPDTPLPNWLENITDSVAHFAIGMNLMVEILEFVS